MILPGHEDRTEFPARGDDGSWLESAVKRFERAWRQGQRPAIEEYLPAGDGRHRVLVELALIDLELRLKAGEAARVEDYLQCYPELAGDRHAVVELIAIEYLLRRRGEPGLVLDDYLRRFPQYREVLPEQLDPATLQVSERPCRPADPPGQTPV